MTHKSYHSSESTYFEIVVKKIIRKDELDNGSKICANTRFGKSNANERLIANPKL